MARSFELLPSSVRSVEDPNLVESFEELANQNPLTLLAAIDRRRKASRTDLDPAKRAELERTAREKYTALLSDVIVRAKLPLVAQLSGLQDEASAWKRIFGTRRSKTLRNRYKCWRAFEKWLEVSYGRSWPNHVGQLLDYAQERFNEGCGKTVLASFQASLSVLETAGRVRDEDMLSKDKTWLTQLASYTADLETLQTARRQAAMLTVAIVLALEVHVMEDSVPEYEMAISWVVLLMVYCSLRADDVQAIAPAGMELTDSGFRARLGRTKTTGPGKKTKEVDIFVERSTGISGWDWMSAGFKIWCNYKQPRDFLVLEANDDWTGPTTKGVDSTGVSLYFRHVLQGLGTPKLESKGFRLNYQRPLMTEGAHRFYTGHSPRNFMTSVAAAIGHSNWDGGWSTGRLARQSTHVRRGRWCIGCRSRFAAPCSRKGANPT